MDRLIASLTDSARSLGIDVRSEVFSDALGVAAATLVDREDAELALELSRACLTASVATPEQFWSMSAA